MILLKKGILFLFPGWWLGRVIHFIIVPLGPFMLYAFIESVNDTFSPLLCFLWKRSLFTLPMPHQVLELRNNIDGGIET